jgi:hypothetical protein
MQTLHVILFASAVIFFVLYIKMSNLPHFMSRVELMDWVQRDPDGWAASHNHINLSVKNAATPEDYIRLCSKNSGDFSWKEKLKLASACKKADNFFQSFGQSRFNQGFQGIRFDVLVHMPWKLACFTKRRVEEGCPHTRREIIFMDDDDLKRMSFNDIVRTMVHEKIHIYERAYPDDIDSWSKSKGFTRWKRERDMPLMKNNPDLDGWVWKDFEGREMYMKFNSAKPKDFWDQTYPVAGASASEHPYETLAYLLDYIYYRLKFYKQPTFLNKDAIYIDKFYDMSNLPN